jgi:excisionase family DNA binding protein
MTPEYVTVNQAAVIFGLGRTVVYALIKSGAIPSAKILLPGKNAGKRLMKADDVRAYIDSQVAPLSEHLTAKAKALCARRKPQTKKATKR